MANEKYNENYVHSCNEQRVKLLDCLKPVSEMYDVEDCSRIFTFYVSSAPTLSYERRNSTKVTALKSLSDYGWRGNAGLTSLERKLLASSSIPFFCFLKSQSIKATLSSMSLGEEICPVHPRAVLQRSVKNVKFGEDDRVTVSYVDSNRMQCLFRHIRNSIAHGLTYEPSSSTILLEDAVKPDSISARLLLNKQTLLDWAEIVEHGKGK